mmetsp:Transcript_168126/g.540000  ORF Transcript_168126/g.540000 Transcript_168126/m.540000 type:complete len:234 (+) Transcript_168126:683-1384(+)
MHARHRLGFAEVALLLGREAPRQAQRHRHVAREMLGQNIHHALLVLSLPEQIGTLLHLPALHGVATDARRAIRLHALGLAAIREPGTGPSQRLCSGPHIRTRLVLEKLNVLFEHLPLVLQHGLLLCLDGSVLVIAKGRGVVDVPTEQGLAVPLIRLGVQDVLVPHEIDQLARNHWSIWELLNQQQHAPVLRDGRARCEVIGEIRGVVALQLFHKSFQIQVLGAMVLRPGAMSV